MLKKLKEMNPAVIIASAAFAGIIILLLLTASIFGIYKLAQGNTDAFEKKYVVQEQLDPQQVDVYSNRSAQQQMALMQQIMEQHEREMQQMQAQFFGSNVASMTAIPSMNMIDMNLSASPGLDVQEMPDKYVVTLDMPGGNFDENVVDVNCHKNRLDIKINQKSGGKNGYSSASMYQSMTLGVPVDVSKVKKETRGDKYIITLPKLTTKNNIQNQPGSKAQRHSII